MNSPMTKGLLQVSPCSGLRGGSVSLVSSNVPSKKKVLCLKINAQITYFSHWEKKQRLNNLWDGG